jgi:hypothetical protein
LLVNNYFTQNDIIFKRSIIVLKNPGLFPCIYLNPSPASPKTITTLYTHLSPETLEGVNKSGAMLTHIAGYPYKSDIKSVDNQDIYQQLSMKQKKIY